MSETLTDEHHDWYCCTEMGKSVAMKSHKTIRYSKARRMYSKFLDIRECFEGLTFKDFLTHPRFADSRREA